LLKPEISRVIAAGGAGTWFTFGYIIYIVVGVIGVAVSALFYYYIQKVLAKQYDSTRVANASPFPTASCLAFKLNSL
jgi:uncharacterized ion transporter superfamily protein YfcC